jgi:hypothetical protein
MLAVLIIFAALAIDIAYMYFEKNQLQVAADAAALAGAAVIFDTNDLQQIVGPTGLWTDSARAKAIEFAAKNRTAGAGATVQLITDNSNTDPILSNSNDISVGYWDGTTYHRGVTPVNALEVVTKRVGGLLGGRGHISLFLGKIFNFFDSDWSFMSAKARAIAAKPPRASNYITLCTEACTGCIYDPNNPTAPPCQLSPWRELDIKNCDPNTGECPTAIAWTSLLNQITSTTQLNPLICTDTPYVNICGHQIYTTGGEVTDAIRNLEANMYDPAIDAENKVIVGNVVQSWTITVPVTQYCPPRAQGGGNAAIEPKDVFGYATIRIRAVCETGVGNPCHQYGGRPCSHERPCTPPPHTCNAFNNNTDIVIDQIQCISCADADERLGNKPVLVK